MNVGSLAMKLLVIIYHSIFVTHTATHPNFAEQRRKKMHKALKKTFRTQMFCVQRWLTYKLKEKLHRGRTDTDTRANTQTFTHFTETEMHWELSRGSGRATQGSHVSKNTQKGAKRRAEHGPDMSAGSDAKRFPQTPPSVWKYTQGKYTHTNRHTLTNTENVLLYIPPPVKDLLC